MPERWQKKKEKNMKNIESKKLPKFKSLDKLVEFFDNNDLGEYMDNMPEADFEINIKKRTHLFTLDDDLAQKITEIAKLKHISSESLIDSWLKEKIQEQANG